MKALEGVYVHALGGACTVQRAQSYEWLSRLVPHLTGGRTLDGIDPPLTAERRVYAVEIACIRYGLGSAERHFQRVCEARIALIGAGAMAGALPGAGLWSRWRNVRVFTPPAQVTALRDVVEAPRCDPKQSVRLQPWPKERSARDRGLLAAIVDEGGLAQVTLSVCRASVSDPDGGKYR